MQEAGAQAVVIVAIGPLVNGESLGAVLLLEVGELSRYLIQGLIPGDAFPLVLAPLPLSLQRIEKLLRAIQPLGMMRHAVAAAVIGGGIVRVAP